MGQSRFRSLLEVIANHLFVSLIISTLLYSWIQGMLSKYDREFQEEWYVGLGITLIFAAVSFARNYGVRWAFGKYDITEQNKKHRQIEALSATIIIGVFMTVLHSTLYQPMLLDWVGGDLHPWNPLKYIPIESQDSYLAAAMLTLVVKFKSMSIVYGIRRYFNNLTVKSQVNYREDYRKELVK